MVDDQEINARTIKHQRDKYCTGAYHQLYQEEEKNKQPKTTPPQSKNPFKTISEIISTYSVYLCRNYLQYKWRASNQIVSNTKAHIPQGCYVRLETHISLSKIK